MNKEKKIPKQVIIVRKDLRNSDGNKVRTGKICAQVAHASMKVLLEHSKYLPDNQNNKTIKTLQFSMEKDSAWDIWLNGLFTKIVVYCNSEEELQEIYDKAKNAGLPCSLIVDSGLTEFKGIPTKTTVAIGPDYPENIDPITKNLKIL
jgi:PTH2 family peptidyl-tRNA hydrolase